ncbi:MAG: acetylxylan esterase [Candidatus Sulfotelmatobacter sp.]
MSRTVPLVPFLLLAAIASAENLRIPSAEGPLTINGVPDEELWKHAIVLPLRQAGFGSAFPSAGEMRAVIRGDYLCLSAQVPETGRVVARSTGANPAWWNEDLLTWSLHFRSFSTYLTVTVNPLGGYRVESTGSRTDTHSVLVSSAMNSDGWSAEAAVPVSSISNLLSISVERIRATRPDSPELRWYWPGLNERLGVELSHASSQPPPPVVVRDWREHTQHGEPRTSSDQIETELAHAPHDVWNDAERKRLGIEGMWETQLRAKVRDAALRERLDWEKVHTVADWENFRDRRIAALKKSLGAFPERTPLRPAVTRRFDYSDGFVLENVIFESRPGLVVTANFYLPSNITGRIPAIVVVHSHHFPKVQAELQDLGMTWARSGTAVLIMDQLGAGERIQTQPWLREGYFSRYALGMQLYLPGESLMKWMVWDLMRGIDLLVEKPYIDPKRIVMLGAVAGGGDPAAVTAALDTRVAAVLPFNFGESGPEEHYTMGPRPYDAETADPGWGEWESTRCLRDSIAGQFFPWLICSSVAPRPFSFSFELAWPHGVEQEPIWKRYKKVFDLYRAKNHLAELDGFGSFPGPGEVEDVGVNHRKKIYPILNRWLDVAIPDEEYHNVRPDADLMALTPKAAAERKPKTASELALKLAQERLSGARSKRASLPAAERLASLRASLQSKLGDISPNAGTAANVVWTKSFASFGMEAVALETEPGMTVPLLLVKPSAVKSERFPVVLAFAQKGKKHFLSDRSAELAALLKSGVAVCLADVRGTGESAPTAKTSSGLESLAATELMLGNTSLGARLKDARTVVRYLSGRRDLDPNRLAVWGDSSGEVNSRGLSLDQSVKQEPGPQVIESSDPAGSLLALLTALYEDNVRAVAGRGGLISYLSVLEDRFCYVPGEVIVPGMLETADIADVVAAIAPRAEFLDAFVDGRDRPLLAAEMQDRLGQVSAFSTAPQLRVTEHAQSAELASWMASQLSR